MRLIHPIAGILVVLLIGCGTESDPEAIAERPPRPREVLITLNGYMGPENVGILMAEERGYFDDLGLAVTITTPETPSRPVRYVAEGTVQFGVSHQPQVAISGARGAPVVAVAGLVPRATAAMIWLRESKIRDIGDLRGKTVVTSGIPFQEELLESVLRRAGMTLRDIKVKRAWYDLIPTLVNGRADAIFGGSWNIEGARLAARGLEPVITRVQSLGIPAYDELVLIARTDLVRAYPELVRDVVSAVARGTAAAVEHPESAVRLIGDSGGKDRDLSWEALEAQVEATLPLLSETGYMDPDQAAELAEWMHGEGITRREVPTAKLLDNGHLGLRP